jgi:hypothetical protein
MARRLAALFVLVMVTACSGGGSVAPTVEKITPTTTPMKWGEEALAWRDAEIASGREGFFNLVQFWDENIVLDDRDEARVVTGIQPMLDHAARSYGVGLVPEPLALFLSADEELNQYGILEIDYMDRQRIGPNGVELIVGAGSAQAGYTYLPEYSEEIDADVGLVDRYVAYWNDSNGETVEDLYASDASIEDTLLGESMQGTEAIAESAGTGEWPDPAPMAVAPIPDGGGPAIYGGFPVPAERDVVDELHVVVEVDNGTGCPGLIGVALGWDKRRVVWERRYHEVESARRCLDTDGLQPGWWEGIEIPNPIQIEHTSTMTWEQGISVDIYNGIPGTEDFVRWGLQRFDQAGLSIPHIGSMTFLIGKSACLGYFGFATTDPNDSISAIALCNRADDICADAACDTWKPEYKAELLHEYAHVWINENVDDATRTEFLDLIGVPNWTDPEIPHNEQGTEYAANTIVCGLLDAEMPQPLAPDWNSQLKADAFTLLTGAEPNSVCQR